MEFTNALKQHAERIKAIKDTVNNEEATKTSMVMPFFSQVLGYNVFDPTEFCPENVADVGTKKGEKVDYAILQDGQPVILIEAKWCGESLDKHASQLFRYFATSPAKFGVLTNGIVYQFYTDLNTTNIMDTKPFLEINLLNLKERYIPELRKFHKENFNVENISGTASELHNLTNIRNYFEAQFEQPDEDFIRFVISKVYDGRATQNKVDEFTPLIAKTLKEYINEKVSGRIAVMSENAKVQETEPAEEEQTDPVSRIVTTQEELEYFYILKGMLLADIGDNDLTYKDTESYFGVLLNNNTRKWVCRLRVDGTKKSIAIADENKNEVKHELTSPADLYALKDELIKAIHNYLED